jgi:hypothetical protein
VTRVSCRDGGVVLEERDFDSRIEAENYVETLLRRSTDTWAFDAAGDRWVCGARELRLKDMAETTEEKLVKVDAKIVQVEVLQLRAAAAEATACAEWVRLDAALAGLLSEKAALEG